MKKEDILAAQNEEAELESAVIKIETPSDAALMPAMSIEDALARRDQMNEIVSKIMVRDKDYGTIPGTKKDTLYKPGAEKLTTFFGLSVLFESVATTENWDTTEPLFYYMEKCKLYKGDFLIAEASGSANSREDRYRWRWTTEKPAPFPEDDHKTRVSSIGHFRWQIEKGETTGQYGKPQEHWDKFAEAVANGTAKIFDKEQSWNKEMAEFIEIETIEYRIPNPDLFTLVNTILKMAQKRALVAATLIACDASEFFTQDLEDWGEDTKPKDKEKTASKPSTDTARDSRAGNAMVNWPLDEQIKHAQGLVDENSTDAEMTNAFWSLGRSLRMDEDYLAKLIQEATDEEGTVVWHDALVSVLGHAED